MRENRALLAQVRFHGPDITRKPLLPILDPVRRSHNGIPEIVGQSAARDLHIEALQLLYVSLSSCCRYRPARVSRRIGQLAAFHAAFALSLRARPLRLNVSRSPVRSLSLRPNDSLTIPKMALLIDFIRFVSSTNAIQATEV